MQKDNKMMMARLKHICLLHHRQCAAVWRAVIATGVVAFAVAVVPGQAHAVKSQSLIMATQVLDVGIATSNPRTILHAIQLTQLAADAPRADTLMLAGRAHYALAWLYFLNDETAAATDEAQAAAGLLNEAATLSDPIPLSVRSWRLMTAELLRKLSATGDPLFSRQAREDLRVLIDEGGTDPLVLSVRAHVAFLRSDTAEDQEETTEALGLFERLRERSPDDRELQAWVIFLRARQDPAQHATAAAALTDMLRTDPAFRLAAFLRGRL
jgi:hypothetical protein